MMNFTQKNEYYCETCGIECSGIESYRQHLKGRRHKKEAERQSSYPQHDMKNSYYCQVCDVLCSSPENYIQHVGGKKHKRLEKRFKQKLNEINEESETKKKLESELVKYERMVEHLNEESNVKEVMNPNLNKKIITEKIKGKKDQSKIVEKTVDKIRKDDKLDPNYKKFVDEEFELMKSDKKKKFEYEKKKETSKLTDVFMDDYAPRSLLSPSFVNNTQYLNPRDENVPPPVFEYAQENELRDCLEKINQGANAAKKIINRYEEKLKNQKEFFEHKISQLIEQNRKLVKENKLLTAQVLNSFDKNIETFV